MTGRRAAAQRVLGWLRPVAGRLLLVLLVGAAQGLVPGAVALLVQRVLDGLMRGEAAGSLPALVVGLYALNGALGFARGMGARAVAWRVVTDVRQAVFDAMLAQEPAWHGERPTWTRCTWACSAS
jgi:ABC-type multidrug transport system fused ATPase/permease subunit